jgi:hypothetical protein
VDSGEGASAGDASNGDHKQFNRARRPKYLFSGLTKCAECGGGYTFPKRDLSIEILRPGQVLNQLLLLLSGRGGTLLAGDVHVAVYDERRPGSILVIGQFKIATGVLVRVVVNR